MEHITTFKRIKEIIEPIPIDKFCAHVYENSKGQCCFLGHIQKSISGDALANEDGFGTRDLTAKFLEESHNIFGFSGANVNNSEMVNGYNEPEIKDRLMHMIEDGIVWENNKKFKK